MRKIIGVCEEDVQDSALTELTMLSTLCITLLFSVFYRPLFFGEDQERVKKSKEKGGGDEEQSSCETT